VRDGEVRCGPVRDTSESLGIVLGIAFGTASSRRRDRIGDGVSLALINTHGVTMPKLHQTMPKLSPRSEPIRMGCAPRADGRTTLSLD